MNLSQFMDNINDIENPLVKMVMLFIALVWFCIKVIYCSLLFITDKIIIPIFNTFLAFFAMRLVVGKSQTGSVWCSHYMLAYKIAPWERFACYENQYLSLTNLYY